MTRLCHILNDYDNNNKTILKQLYKNNYDKYLDLYLWCQISEKYDILF